ncbi:hypothetical protein BAE44_0004149 [Dichanthelium oligosanthes]|uniref:DUF1618 domain-containing protein n=1 Tax=Dichanthelium oligosanthes TaxID=888268 RepID=A0A1E5WBM7_9POAL|nr:hypothetical protein BAE44_0004149 [Dichanthelium oligosanthes]
MDSSLAPRVVSADADLVLLRVPLDPMARMSPTHSDYFVYRARPQGSTLHLLPRPEHDRISDDEIAVLSCGDGGEHAVAALQIRPLSDDFTFTLQLYRSGPGGEPGSWTSQPVSVEEPQRDRVCPIPDTAARLMYHLMAKVITIGGAKGTIGWVDLWRGILLCDETPKVRDMPLPLPGKANWKLYLNGCPYYSRDVTVNQSKDTIKYVEMEITPPTMVAVAAAASDPESYHEWLDGQKNKRRLQSYRLYPGRWKATTWNMPIPVMSWEDWQHRCTVHSEDIELPADNTRDCDELLHKLKMISSANKEEKATQATLSLGCLHMAHPTMSIADDDDDDVVYLLSKGTIMGTMDMLAVAVDLRAGTLQGMPKLDTKRHLGFMRCYLASSISKHLDTTGICGNRQAEDDAVLTSNKDIAACPDENIIG